VGKPIASDAELLEILTGRGYLPVVACVAGDGRGGVYNVNADQMAVACAAGFGADLLLFLTDVAGVMGPDQRIISQLTAAECANLISRGIATGGMQAKLNAASDALDKQVGQVIIAPGAEAEIVRRLLDGEPVGTRLIRATVHHE
jgi:acetylglutamate kinase